MTVIRPIQLEEYRPTPAFRATGIRGAALRTGHVLNIDHFHMSQPMFPPHPHAGFSAVTYMLEDSPGAFINRDSRGDTSRIGPGTLHWTLAGSGVIHEEVPERPGVDCHGLQIFVKLPRKSEEMEPASFHVEAAELPEVTREGVRARVLVGAFEGRASSIRLPAPTTILDVQLAAGAQLDLSVPDGEEAFAMVLSGRGRLGDVPVQRDMASALSPGSLRIAAEDGPLQLIVAHSPPLVEKAFWSGPFCMSDRSRLETAQQRYRSGAMGSLAPYFA